MIKNIRVWFYGHDNIDFSGKPGYPYAYEYGMLTDMERDPLVYMIMNDDTGEILFERSC